MDGGSADCSRASLGPAKPVTCAAGTRSNAAGRTAPWRTCWERKRSGPFSRLGTAQRRSRVRERYARQTLFASSNTSSAATSGLRCTVCRALAKSLPMTLTFAVLFPASSMNDAAVPTTLGLRSCRAHGSACKRSVNSSLVLARFVPIRSCIEGSGPKRNGPSRTLNGGSRTPAR
jgi:hypothetical protein